MIALKLYENDNDLSNTQNKKIYIKENLKLTYATWIDRDIKSKPDTPSEIRDLDDNRELSCFKDQNR